MPIRSSALAVLTATALLVGTASPAALRAASPGPTGDGELPVGRGGASHLAHCHRGLAAAAAAVDITPMPPPGHTLSEVYLGGYGLGPHRPAAWVRDPLFARALVLGCAGQTGSAVAVEEIDNQGMSVAYRPTVGPYGLEDIRTAAASAAGISRSHIIMATDHSHAGPDLIGVWGFVPTWYLQQVAAGASRAIATAAATLRPVTLSVGSVRAPELVHTQFDDPSVGALDHVDDGVRVLRATAADGTVVSTLVDFAAHSTVMGSTNRGVSPDWPGRLATMLEAAGGNGTVVVLEGTNGKTQPVRPVVPDDIQSRPEMTSPSDPVDGDGYSLQTYATSLAQHVGQAVANVQPVSGDRVGGETLYLADAATNPVLLGLLYGGAAFGAQVERSFLPPWGAANVLGTLVGSLRVGDVVIDGAPGEAYPAIQNTVITSTPGLEEHFFAGLAYDQLGYLIAPASETSTAASAALGGNDNLLFNTTPAIGDHVTCVLLQALAENGAKPLQAATPADCTGMTPGVPEDSVVGAGSPTTDGLSVPDAP